MKIQYVPLAAVHKVWGIVAPFLEEALDHSNGDYTVEQVKVYISGGEWLLLVAVDDADVVCGAAAMKFYNRPSDRVAFVVAMGGKLITSQDTFDQFKGYCVANGATVVEGTARESTVRLWTRYGFKEKSRIVGAKL